MSPGYRSLAAGLFALALLPGAARSQELTLVGRLDQKHGVSGGVYYSGSWGYVAPDLREYAILTTATGTAIIDITDTSDIHEVVHIGGPTSLWREVRTWGNRLYVVTEAGGGTQIIDLSQLPDTATLVKSFTYTDGPRNTARAHTVEIFDGYLYLNGCANWGTTTAEHGAVIFSLADPDNPDFVGEYSPNYFHDSFVRNDTIFGASIYSDGGIYIADITDKAAPVPIGEITYAGSGTHNVWSTKDGRYLISTDEIGSTQKTLKFWDLGALPTVPVAPVATYAVNPVDIGHNVFVRGDYAYAAWYTAGIAIAGISDPTSPDTVDSYDTSTEPNGSYNGVWAVYPYFWSGKVIAGDMQNGLYVFTFDSLRARTPVTLLEPADSTVIVGAPPVNFRWTRAADPSADPVQYLVEITGPSFDTTFAAGSDTSAVFNGAGMMAPGEFSWRVITADVANRVPSQESLRLVKAGTTVIAPAGGEGLVIASSYPVTWTTPAETVQIAWSSNAGASWAGIATVPAAPPSYDWLVPGSPTTDGLIRIRDAADTLSADVSDAPFSVCAAKVDAEAGWDLLSVPSNPEDLSAGFHFPHGSHVYAYQAGYIRVDTLMTGSGYWVKHDSARTLFSIGTPLVLDTIGVAQNWNIVGSLSAPVSAASILFDPPTMGLGAFYAYSPDSGYVIVDSILPGHGYWVKCSEAGSIILDTGAASNTPGTLPVTASPELRGRISFTRDGMTRTLSFGNRALTTAELAASALPPPPPGGFDVRFAGDTKVGVVIPGPEPQIAEIVVRGASGPVEVKLETAPGEGGRWILRTQTPGGSGAAYVLSSSPIAIDAAPGRLLLEAGGEAGPPLAYRVLQNSPNPFNPSTVIRYELRGETRVRLEVFSLLGEKVAVLVDGIRPAGMNEAVFRADGLPSGTYFYVLNAGGKTLSGKMLLAR